VTLCHWRMNILQKIRIKQKDEYISVSLIVHYLKITLKPGLFIKCTINLCYTTQANIEVCWGLWHTALGMYEKSHVNILQRFQNKVVKEPRIPWYMRNSLRNTHNDLYNRTSQKRNNKISKKAWLTFLIIPLMEYLDISVERLPWNMH